MHWILRLDRAAFTDGRRAGIRQSDAINFDLHAGIQHNAADIAGRRRVRKEFCVSRVEGLHFEETMQKDMNLQHIRQRRARILQNFIQIGENRRGFDRHRSLLALAGRRIDGRHA